MIYRFFFQIVENADHQAEKMESEGKNADELRTHYQREAGLTADEGTTMKQIAYECNQALKDRAARKAEAREAYGTAWRPSCCTQGVHSHDATEPPHETRDLVNSFTERLRSMLGESSYQKLDAYIKRNTRNAPPKPGVHAVPAPPPPNGPQAQVPARPN